MTKPFNADISGPALAALAVAVMASAAPVVARPASVEASDPPSRVAVSYADLDIGQAAGAKILLRRIRRAAEDLCGGPPDPRLLAERIALDQCSKPLVAAAVAQVDSAALTALAASEPFPARVAGR